MFTSRYEIIIFYSKVRFSQILTEKNVIHQMWVKYQISCFSTDLGPNISKLKNRSYIYYSGSGSSISINNSLNVKTHLRTFNALNILETGRLRCVQPDGSD